MTVAVRIAVGILLVAVAALVAGDGWPAGIASAAAALAYVGTMALWWSLDG